jgi:hypothetical protein
MPAPTTTKQTHAHGLTLDPNSLEFELASSLAVIPSQNAQQSEAAAEQLLQAAQSATQRMDIIHAAHCIIAACRHLKEDAGAQAGQASVPSLPGSSAPTPDNVSAHLNALHERLVHHTSMELQRACVAENAATAARYVCMYVCTFVVVIMSFSCFLITVVR